MSRSAVYTLHLWPPLGHARHYTGSTRKLPERLVDHALGRGARMLQVQRERGGTWVIAQTEPGGRFREYQLKNEGGASRRCHVCKAVDGYQAGRLSQDQALDRAGWNGRSEFERSLLLEIFGLESSPEKIPEVVSDAVPARLERRPAPEPVNASAEINALVDALIESWTPKAHAGPGAEAQMEAGA